MFNLNKENIINIICGILLIGLMVVLIVCLTKNDSFKDEMKNINNESELCIFIDNPNCGFSKKMKSLLEQNNMKIGDINVITKNIMTDGKELANEHNIEGTPGFIYFTRDKQTGRQKVKTSTGFKPLEQLEKELKEDNVIGNNGKEIVIIGMNTCPFCTKTYGFLDKNNIKYKKVAPNSPEGQSLIQKLGRNTGVPICLVMNNGNILKHKVGYHEDLSFYD